MESRFVRVGKGDFQSTVRIDVASPREMIASDVSIGFIGERDPRGSGYVARPIIQHARKFKLWGLVPHRIVETDDLADVREAAGRTLKTSLDLLEDFDGRATVYFDTDNLMEIGPVREVFSSLIASLGEFIGSNPDSAERIGRIVVAGPRMMTGYSELMKDPGSISWFGRGARHSLGEWLVKWLNKDYSAEEYIDVIGIIMGDGFSRDGRERTLTREQFERLLLKKMVNPKERLAGLIPFITENKSSMLKDLIRRHEAIAEGDLAVYRESMRMQKTVTGYVGRVAVEEAGSDVSIGLTGSFDAMVEGLKALTFQPELNLPEILAVSYAEILMRHTIGNTVVEQLVHFLQPLSASYSIRPIL